MRSETITIGIPAGVSDGARIRVPEKGNAGERRGRAGDLYLAVQVAPHETFVREGDDFHIVVPIGVHEAALGARFEVPAPDGTAVEFASTGGSFSATETVTAILRTTTNGIATVQLR